MNQKERMLAGLPYKANMDGLPQERLEARKKMYEFNHLPPENQAQAELIIRSLLGKAGKNIYMEPPFYCDYGSNIFVGDNFYSNFHCVMLDVGKIEIGDRVMFGPNVSVFTAGHPVHPQSRASGYEYGMGVRIGSDVWVGGGSIINAGVTIGDGSVIGAGSVVTKDIPAGVIAVGNPCRVLRAITEEDRDYYYKDRKFDVDDYKNTELPQKTGGNWAYLLRCADNSLYAGWTNNLEQRLIAHNAGKGAKYTRSRTPAELVWYKEFDTPSQAMKQEAALKKMTRAQKMALVETFDKAGE